MTGQNGTSQGDAAVADEVARLVRALRNPTGPEREQAVSALAALGERAGDTEDGDVRAGVAQALGKIGAPQAVDPLLAIFADEDEPCDVRVQAALALGAIRDPRALEPLVRFIAEPDTLYNHDATVGWFVVEALGMLGDARALPALMGALVASDVDMRKAASSALARIGPLAVPPLLAMLGDRTRPWRGMAAITLGAIGDRRAVAPLMAALRDHGEDEHVRAMAALALGRIGDRAAFDLLVSTLRDSRGPEHVRRMACHGLGLLRDVRALPVLVEALDLPVPSLRHDATYALGDLGDARAVPTLLALAAPDDRDASMRGLEAAMRWRAAEALGKLGDPQALPTLRRLQDYELDRPLAQMVRQAAGEAITRIEARQGGA